MKCNFFIIATAFVMTACTINTNPFLSEWDTPYGIPPFDKISDNDFIPAIKEGISQHNKQIQTICENKENPTFQNTILPLELSAEILSKVSGVISNIYETDRTEALDSVYEIASALLSEHNDDIFFNKKLYERINKIYQESSKDLTREEQMVLKKYYDSFEHNGVGLPQSKQNELKKINAEIASKTQKIGNNILNENNEFKKKFNVSISEFPNAMTTTEDRKRREAMYNAYITRGHNGGSNDNTSLALEVIDLRIKKAEIMGYDSPASYILSQRMAHDPATVDKFLGEIMLSATKKAKEELIRMQKEMDKEITLGILPKGSKIEPWDWWYYAEKVRKEEYNLDDNSIKPYFHIDKVTRGVFAVADSLYGIKMEKIENVPVYSKGNVTTYKVKDSDGNFLGIFTTDYFPRATKRGGAWMNNIREQYIDENGNDIRPIIVNVANLDTNLNIDGVETIFHEFGHALHGMLTKCHYKTISGTNVKRDFVEMFSNFNENWMDQPEFLKLYAINDQGEVIPDEMIEKIRKSSKFNQGFMTTELCAAAILDMRLHELKSVEGLNLDDFEKQVSEQMGLIPEIGPRYRTTYFNHIFCSGYEAGYYGYLWAEILDKDAFSLFQKSPDGIVDHKLAEKFKKTFLEKGGSEEPMVLFKEFTGREPDSKPFLEARGL